MITREWAVMHPPGRYRCPQCEASEKACAVWDESGYRRVQCHRATCAAFAKYPLGYLRDGEQPVPTPSAEVLRPYTGVLYDWILPILDPMGRVRGHMEMNGPGHPKYRKIWKAKDEPMISWSMSSDSPTDELWLAEDQVSARKFRHVTGIRACALLGTNLTTGAVAEIQKHAANITIALDADATSKAFLLARRWGAAFKSCRVQILTKDIKDMQINSIQELVNARYTDSSGVHSGQASVDEDCRAHRPSRSDATRRVLVEGNQ